MSKLDFDWENAEASNDFFSEPETEVIEKGESEVEVGEETQEEEEENEAPANEDNLFGEEDDSDGPEEEDDKQEVGNNISVLNSLKDKGFISFELEEGQELTEELAEELLEDKFEEAIDEGIKEKLTGLPEDAQEVIQFCLQGGTVGEYFKALSEVGSVSLTEDMDLEDESNQETIIRELLAQEDNDSEYIESQIEFLQDSGKMKLFAEKKYNKWLQERKITKQNMLKAQEENARKSKENIRKAKMEVIEELNSSQEIGGLEFTKEDKKVLPSYMNDKTVKLNNGAVISEMQKVLHIDLPKNNKAMIQLAALLRGRNKDGTFNFDKISNKAATKVTQKIKADVRRSKTAIPNSGTRKYKAEKRLADYFK